MQQTELGLRTARTKCTWNGVERRRVEKVVETLATLRSRGESLSEVAHDARNMVTALGLYCDLLEEPGVLATAFTHYAHELRLVAAASRRLVEKLVALDANAVSGDTVQTLLQASSGRRPALPDPAGTSAVARAEATSAGAPAAGNAAACAGTRPGPAPSPIWNSTTVQNRNQRWDLLPALPVSNLAAELLANRNLLAALAGPSVALTMEANGGAQAVRLTGEDLTRLLVNLVKNAAEAMPQAPTQTMTQGRRIHIGLREGTTAKGTAPSLALSVEDSGPGIPEAALEKIFTSGYTSRGNEASESGWPQSHRGLGLAIVRSIVEGAGGRITASNRAQGGACFTIEIPVRKTGV
ncbi:MAG: ATP-binding protein [Terracidiphilus sp.]|jgi:signal transduction histidine kinase